MWDFKMFQGSLAQRRARHRRATSCSARSATATSPRSTRGRGKHLWHFQTGANMSASPMSYAVGGRQFVAISAGNTRLRFALPK